MNPTATVLEEAMTNRGDDGLVVNEEFGVASVSQSPNIRRYPVVSAPVGNVFNVQSSKATLGSKYNPDTDTQASQLESASRRVDDARTWESLMVIALEG
ncbi:hypothetical protein A2713_00940 [candidate division WWE3 bacterium RIFCSPHIGHO2_01_FULL_35_17]|uniref:Uncharacterized protein n=1 Tax=candidate division WWE3 bacterium RIFCSPHIGHO2_01_FULL_35_17 TaxID=1802614 RepID=A0A1F4UPR9_UNCKA|nr:MAG: hypothetical protein A2713_00940 [candidate division WWE3 bacterium RIFCSPHIGHO2_01_FULL_35_17]